MIYGPGLNNFLKINSRLIGLFIVLSLLGMLQIASYRGFGGVADWKKYGWQTNLSFASIGFPMTLCSKAVLDWESDSSNYVFQCPKSTIVTGEIFSSGIVSYANVTDYKGIVESFAKCYYSPDQYDAYLFPLMEYFDEEGFNNELRSQCVGERMCNVTISNSYFAVPEDLKQPGQFAFSQLACKSTDEMLDLKIAAGLVGACLGLWMCLITSSVFSFMSAET